MGHLWGDGTHKFCRNPVTVRIAILHTLCWQVSKWGGGIPAAGMGWSELPGKHHGLHELRLAVDGPTGDRRADALGRVTPRGQEPAKDRIQKIER